MPFAPTYLRCEYRNDPNGVDAVAPRLSWIYPPVDQPWNQSAYRILVASSATLLSQDQGDLWDTGIRKSNENIQIVYEGLPLRSRDECLWKVMAWGEGVPTAWSKPAKWTMGLLTPADWTAQWIGIDERPEDTETHDRLATPRYLRREFSLRHPVTNARVYVTALGLYELRVNGHRVGDHRLSPEWTNYHRRVQYQTYDVTDFLKAGNNVVAAVLGNGWYCGNWQHWEPRLRRIYGEQPYLLMQLMMNLADGSQLRIVSDTDWYGTTHGPLRFSGIYEGETFDATRDMPGWDSEGFTLDEKWRRTTVANPRVGDLVWQRSEPIRVTQSLEPVAITEPKPGTFVFDFGQNFAGCCRLRVNEPAGTTVVLKHNEMLSPDGTVYMDNLHAGHLSHGDRQVVRYTCAGIPDEEYEPYFTYQGFRYVEATGFSAPPTPETLTARVFHTSFCAAGEFECSNALVNRLVKNIQWSQRSNFMGVPTDCPQRDERCGYSGDANFFTATAVYNFDVAAFYNKWLVDLCNDSQRAEGGFADHAPDYGKGGSQNVGWSDAGIVCPYLMYRTYGDVQVIREHYRAMKRNLDMQIATSRDNLRGPDHVGLGDWLNLGGGASLEVIGTAYFAHCCRLMAEMAGSIGEVSDATQFSDRANAIRVSFAEKLIDHEGRIRESSQTGYALAFSMGLIPEAMAPLSAQKFANEIDRFGGRLATGFIGTPRLLPALHLAGRDDLAYQLLLGEEFPSWLYPVKHGATTIWERWDGWTPAGFADSAMNSFNHYAFGSVGEYIFRYIAGISELEPGYRRILIRPVIRAGLSWVTAAYESIQGRIESAWRCIGDQLTLAVRIPANTSAAVSIPCDDRSSVTVNGQPLDSSDVAADESRTHGSVTVEVKSGFYWFQSIYNLNRS